MDEKNTLWYNEGISGVVGNVTMLDRSIPKLSSLNDK